MKNITEVLIMLFAVLVLSCNSYAANDNVPANVGNPSSNPVKEQAKDAKEKAKEEKDTADSKVKDKR